MEYCIRFVGADACIDPDNQTGIVYLNDIEAIVAHFPCVFNHCYPFSHFGLQLRGGCIIISLTLVQKFNKRKEERIYGGSKYIF